MMKKDLVYLDGSIRNVMGEKLADFIARNIQNMQKCNSAYRIELVSSWKMVIGKF
jgi:hypothetical protein